MNTPQSVTDPSTDPSSEMIRVSARSRSTAVAGAIAGIIRRERYAEVQAIGASAVNQAIKAIAIARSYLDKDEIDLLMTPGFYDVEVGGMERTAVRFAIYGHDSASVQLNLPPFTL